MLSLCLRAARVFGKDCLRQLLATVENITNVKYYLVLFTNWSYTPASSVIYQAVHNLWQTLSVPLCAQRQSLLGMNTIGLPVTNLPSSWCIYTNRERSAQACPHFIVNTNTPGVDGVSSCEKHTKTAFEPSPVHVHS